MIGRVGGDGFGQQLRSELELAGVDVSGVTVDSAVTSGIAVIHIDASGQNRIVQIPGANARCGQLEAARVAQALGQASVLMLQLEVPLEVSPQAAREASSLGRPVVLDPAPAVPATPRAIPAVRLHNSQRDRGGGAGGLLRT